MKKIFLFLIIGFVLTFTNLNAVTVNHYSFQKEIPTIEPPQATYFGSVQIRCISQIIGDRVVDACFLNCGGSGGTTCDFQSATSCDCDENVGPSDVIDRVIETESDDLFDYAEDQVYNSTILNGSYNLNIIKSGITYNRTVVWNSNTTTNKTTIHIDITKITP